MNDELNQPAPFTQRLLIGTAIASTLFAFLDFMYTKHPHIKFEELFNFYGFIAIISAVALIVFASSIRSVIGKAGDYYDD